MNLICCLLCQFLAVDQNHDTLLKIVVLAQGGEQHGLT